MFPPVCPVWGVYTGIFTDMLMAPSFILMPVISSSLFSKWLFQDCHCVMYRSGPGLYHSDNVATSLLSIATKSSWSVIMHTYLTNQ